jgi:hypothetical protein
MAKATDHKPAKRRRKIKVGATPESALDGISVNEAFHLMLAQFQPHAARERLDVAIRANEVSLRGNGEVMDPNFFATHLRVAARTEPDGRWISRIEPTAALVPGEYIWTVSRAEIVNLLHQPPHVEKRKPAESAASEPAITKEALARQLIQKLYKRPPHEIPKKEAKTGTIRKKVNDEQKEREDPEHFSWDTINRALGRDPSRKQK